MTDERATGDDAPDVDLMAASLRADAGDMRTFLPALAARFEGALPDDMVRVQREGGLFRRERAVESVSISIGESTWTIQRAPGGVAAEVERRVRGIRISGESVPVESWIGSLSAHLADFAARSAAGRDALGRLLG